MRAVAKPLSRALGREVVIRPTPGGGGWTALEKILDADSESTVLATASLSLATKEFYGNRDFSLDLLNPIAQFGNGFSVALIARRGADYADWSALSRAATQRVFTVATTGPDDAFGVAEKMLQKVLKADFIPDRRHGPREIYDAVVSGNAELGVITDPLITSFNDATDTDGAVAIVNFGADRSETHPDVPTLAEVSGDATLYFSIALGLYGNQGMTDTTAATIYHALVAAAAEPEYVATGYPTTIKSGTEVRKAYQRELNMLSLLDAKGNN